tara:strand:+ start:183 stop:467 length:285 start_codon:yes stop_codon:yes gene_type:complete
VTEITENEKLVLAVVPNSSANAVEASLLEDGFRVTRINSAGGFLKRGNVTVLIGARADQVDQIIEKIKSYVRPDEESDSGSAVFVLPVSRFTRV